MPIDPEFLSILVCPRTRKPLRMASASELARVNDAIKAGSARNWAGTAPKDALEEGLVPDGEPVVYPVQQGIPILLIQEAIKL